MSYALRTTLILGGFWLLVFLVGVYQVHFRMSDQEEVLIAQEAKVAEELEINETLVASLPMIQDELNDVELQWSSRKKFIPRIEASHSTYDYFDQIVTRQKTTLNFDFIAKEVTDSSGVLYSNYMVIGEAVFIDLFRFIWYLEHLPRYLRINSLEMNEATTEDKATSPNEHWVKFTLSITALSADRDGFDEIGEMVDITPLKTKYDPFKLPSVNKRRIPPNSRGLPNVFSSTLRALTPTQVYLIDQNEELKILDLGDEVYLGKLVDIIPDDGRAVFDLNQLYPPRKVPLSLDTGK